ncbi:MAG: hypothetical protein K5850_06565 [Bacteroidales bacterium]|nr:hypothetical protein [Bacteroidales bacterium]
MIRLLFLSIVISASLMGCTKDDPYSYTDDKDNTASSEGSSDSNSENQEEEPDHSGSSSIQWKYDKGSDTYYVVGIVYCDNPADKDYEQMGIFIPGAYVDATANSNGTYSCTINGRGTKNGFTAGTAPVVIPVNTPGYKAMSPPSGFSSGISNYTEKGFIYLYAGCRGKDSSAPSAVTDLKAAIRYFRYLAAQKEVPGAVDRIFSFGHSGGGAQSAILGASGNSPLYDAYLEKLGAKMDYKDDIAGSMCWCPITNLDMANGAYEWNMGKTRSSLSQTDLNISKALTKVFAGYINAIGFVHPTTGEKLELESTSDGYYQSGSYYEYVIEVINDAIARYNKYNSASIKQYSTADAGALGSFAGNYKKATKGLAAFDAYDGVSRTSAANMLFDPNGVWAHYDKYLAGIVGEFVPEYKSAFDEDLALADVYGNNLATRLAMYTPLYYLIDNDDYYPGGYGSSTVAAHWRIRTGIEQGDTSLCTEINLALGLLKSGVQDVDFASVWGQGHTQAEDSGSGSSNFITWVERCCSSN